MIEDDGDITLYCSPPIIGRREHAIMEALRRFGEKLLREERAREVPAEQELLDKLK
jgi:hypothetical protein